MSCRYATYFLAAGLAIDLAVGLAVLAGARFATVLDGLVLVVAIFFAAGRLATAWLVLAGLGALIITFLIGVALFAVVFFADVFLAGAFLPTNFCAALACVVLAATFTTGFLPPS
ncbi:hypothetical protein N9O62_01185, partial [Burkholderiaceae bacterium]|nr:hypothetical protein [Burkholderiaceae bacterium]